MNEYDDYVRQQEADTENEAEARELLAQRHDECGLHDYAAAIRQRGAVTFEERNTISIAVRLIARAKYAEAQGRDVAEKLTQVRHVMQAKPALLRPEQRAD